MLRRFLPSSLRQGECAGLLQSAVVSLVLAGYRALFAVRSGSWWLFTLALYSQVLVLLWLVLLFGEASAQNRPEAAKIQNAFEQCIVRHAARLLLLLWLPLSGMMVLAVLQNASFSYPGHMIYAMALYAFYAVTASAAALFRRRKCRRPIPSAARMLRLVRALTSLFGLQTALLARFSPEGAGFPRLWNALTGGAVSAAALAAAVLLLARTSSSRPND